MLNENLTSHQRTSSLCQSVFPLLFLVTFIALFQVLPFLGTRRYPKHSGQAICLFFRMKISSIVFFVLKIYSSLPRYKNRFWCLITNILFIADKVPAEP